MKFFFNGGGFHELVETLIAEGHTPTRNVPPWTEYVHNDKSWREFNMEILRNAIERERPDVYICSKGGRLGRYIYPETTEWIKQRVHLTAYWSMDDPFFMPTFLSRRLYRGYNIALTCSTSPFGDYRKVGMQPYLFWPAWDTITRKYEPVPEEKKIDFVFVGTPYVCTDIPRKDVMLWIAESGWSMEIYGSANWLSDKVIGNNRNPKFIQGDPRLKPYYKGEWTDWQTLPTLFSKARINFSNHVVRASMYLNDRVPMIMGVGGCLVMDINPGVDKVFKHNFDIVFYKNWDTLQHRMNYFLKNVYARQELEHNARQTVLAKHTYKARAYELLEILARHGVK